MGTIVSVKKGSQAVIATDCWNVRDPMIKQNFNLGSHCISKIGDTYLGINATYGFQTAFDAAVQTIGVKNLSFSNRIDVHNSFMRIHELMRQQFYMLVHFQNTQDFEWTPMNAIVLNESGLFKVDTTRGVYEFSKFWAVGTAEAYALGALEAIYDEKESAENIARTALRSCREFDSNSTGDIMVFHLIPPLRALGSAKENTKSNEEKLKKLRPMKGGKVTRIR